MPSTFKKTVVEIPTITPIQDARNSHFRMLTKRTDPSTIFFRTMISQVLVQISSDAVAVHEKKTGAERNGRLSAPNEKAA